MATVEMLGLVQLRPLCQMLQIPAPTFTSVGETRADITKRCVGPAGYRVAHFLAEQTADAVAALAAQPAVLDVGSLAPQGETTAMVLPIVFHSLAD